MDWTIRVSIHGGVMIFVVAAMSRPTLIPTHHIQSEAKFYSLARPPGMYAFIYTTPPPAHFHNMVLGFGDNMFTVSKRTNWLVSFYTKPMWSVCIICLYADFCIVMSQTASYT
jgi:hypothetical protein